eukprot:TRINITY_DN6238_c0_g1_i10.p1 TRINITY_DN6238_c0_g1~~TRINITY_DN6238_c0_g1_i10.p1  ORF type:complete len:479 (+),score=102.69 TRINITY_DN6238_c0_g1_i10:194-1630(+)
MLKNLKKLFKVKLLPNSFEKTLLNYSFEEEDFNVESARRLTKILQTLDGKNDECNAERGLVLLLDRLNTTEDWVSALKLLFAMHLAVHSLDYRTVMTFASFSSKNITSFNTSSKELREWIHASIVPYYYGYLRKLAYSYSEIKMIFHRLGKGITPIPPQDGDEQVVLLLYKISNLLEYILKINDYFSIALVEFQNILITKKVARTLYLDCLVMYNFLSYNIRENIEHIFEMSDEHGQKIYTLYIEVIRITKAMRAFYELHNHFDEPVYAPNYFLIDGDLNKQLESKFSSDGAVSALNNSRIEKPAATPTPTPAPMQPRSAVTPVRQPQMIKIGSTKNSTNTKELDPAASHSMKPQVNNFLSSNNNNYHTAQSSNKENGEGLIDSPGKRTPSVQFPPTLKVLEDYDVRLNPLSNAPVPRKSDFCSTEPFVVDVAERDLEGLNINSIPGARPGMVENQRGLFMNFCREIQNLIPTKIQQQ